MDPLGLKCHQIPPLRSWLSSVVSLVTMLAPCCPMMARGETGQKPRKIWETDSQMLNVWYIYLHLPPKLPSFVGKYTYHTLSLWDWIPNPRFQNQKMTCFTWPFTVFCFIFEAKFAKVCSSTWICFFLGDFLCFFLSWWFCHHHFSPRVGRISLWELFPSIQSNMNMSWVYGVALGGLKIPIMDAWMSGLTVKEAKFVYVYVEVS